MDQAQHKILYMKKKVVVYLFNELGTHVLLQRINIPKDGDEPGIWTGLEMAILLTGQLPLVVVNLCLQQKAGIDLSRIGLVNNNNHFATVRTEEEEIFYYSIWTDLIFETKSNENYPLCIVDIKDLGNMTDILTERDPLMIRAAITSTDKVFYDIQEGKRNL